MPSPVPDARMRCRSPGIIRNGLAPSRRPPTASMSRPMPPRLSPGSSCSAHGLPEQDAAIVAHCLVSADLRGVDTHGIARLPGYLDRVRRGLINARPQPQARAGDAGRGHARRPGRVRLRGRHARDRGGDRDGARLRHRRRVGAAQHPFRHGGVLRAAGDRGRLHGDGVLQRLAGDAAVGRQGRAARHQSVLRRRARRQAARRSCSTCRRRSRRAARSGAPSAAARPSRSAMRSTRTAAPTTDPKAALGGVVLPIGTYKGSGISMMMDIFGGVISGAAFAGNVGDQYKVYDRAAGRRTLLPGDEAEPVHLRRGLSRAHGHAGRARARACRRRRAATRS